MVSPVGDVEFRAVFDATFEDIRRYCLRRLAVSDVNDAVSTVYLVAWRRIEELPAGDDALPWLYGVARNVVRNTQRSNRRLERLRARLAREPENPADEDLPLIRPAQDEVLLAAMADLSPADQEVIKLRAWEGLSAAAIAQTLGCSVAAAEKRVARALARLRQRYISRAKTASHRISRNGDAGGL